MPQVRQHRGRAGLIGNNTENNDLLSAVQKEARVIQLKDLYLRMTRVSDRYTKLKAIFDKFGQLATSHLTSEECPVKGITFSPKLDKNYFDVSFVGKKVRFSFFVAEDESHFLQGFVKCNPVGKDEESLYPVIAEFSFNHQADTTLKTPEGDPLGIDAEWAAGYLVLHFLSDAIDKKETEQCNAANS